MDSGPRFIREELNDYLIEHGITVRAVLCSHAHYDHTENNRFLQKKYGAEVIMSVYDAGVLYDTTALKSVFYSYTPQENEQYNRHMICAADRVIFPGQEKVDIDGNTFGILRLPGHAASQLGFVTPDGAAYLADSILKGGVLEGKRLIFMLNWKDAFRTLETIKGFSFQKYMLAHSGSCDRVEELVLENERAFREQLETFYRHLQAWSDFAGAGQEALFQEARRWYGFASGNYMKIRIFEWIIRSMAEYYMEQGILRWKAEDGRIVYDTVDVW